MRLDIPHPIVEVCRHLQAAGHQAVVVGGAVRNLLIQQGSPEAPGPKDYDVASSALPEQVIELFGAGRTIPTGIEHGTVTVLLRGEDPDRTEITTFRTDGAYSDGRRPDSVQFVPDLREDLARRDFTINAMAYDPVAGELHDPFGGIQDLEARWIRAVGRPEDRFEEDALRMLRAPRFAAQLGFYIHASTHMALLRCAALIQRVSRERVRDELLKLLAASSPSRGIAHMVAAMDAGGGLLAEMIDPRLFQSVKLSRPFRLWIELVDRASPEARLAAFLWPLRGLPKNEMEALLRHSLKLPSKVQKVTLEVMQIEGPASEHFDSQHLAWDEVAVRRWMSQHDPEALDIALSLHAADTSATSYKGLELDELRKCVAEQRAKKVPLRISDLAVGGKELEAMGLKPGPRMGTVLRGLLEEVLRRPELNTAEQLRCLAQTQIAAQ